MTRCEDSVLVARRPTRRPDGLRGALRAANRDRAASGNRVGEKGRVMTSTKVSSTRRRCASCGASSRPCAPRSGSRGVSTSLRRASTSSKPPRAQAVARCARCEAGRAAAASQAGCGRRSPHEVEQSQRSSTTKTKGGGVASRLIASATTNQLTPQHAVDQNRCC
jgi:hypothetical protein